MQLVLRCRMQRYKDKVVEKPQERATANVAVTMAGRSLGRVDIFRTDCVTKLLDKLEIPDSAQDNIYAMSKGKGAWTGTLASLDLHDGDTVQLLLRARGGMWSADLGKGDHSGWESD